MRLFFIALFTLLSLNSFALQVGAERYEQYLPLLKQQRVALVVNQSAYTKDGHLLDSLLAKGVAVSKVFAPEHGFRGNHDAGEHVASNTDIKTGIPILSLYGKNKRPKAEQLHDVDVIIFDIQDVGVRFYTYISTMHYMMEAAAEYNKIFIVLDRPNPNITYVDGPILEPKFKSFVGLHPIPVLHGLTVGELAKMIVGEGWLEESKPLDLKVIPIEGYTASMTYDLPIKPSPNLPNARAIALYPSLCFFEATPVSVGRGTEFPFQVYGYAPVKLGEFSFTPEPIIGAALNPKLNGQSVFGVDLRNHKSNGLDLSWLITAHQQLSKQRIELFTHASFMDKLAGTDKLRLAIEGGDSQRVIKQRWQRPLQHYLQRRQPYLLYKR
ncbi:hypothetical protein PCIT_a2183 [Pseudoalteromonas citrea]|uniref:DUF1343 domain-containing protein n=2 Tax=Pseudoalteromonas citrea TaxID=43655 RepID=A0AAD4AJC6_9GAMM|nr:hypothetical protein PCIT_a2183 [Pseudoalteromonas citrea]